MKLHIQLLVPTVTVTQNILSVVLGKGGGTIGVGFFSVEDILGNGVRKDNETAPSTGENVLCLVGMKFKLR